MFADTPESVKRMVASRAAPARAFSEGSAIMSPRALDRVPLESELLDAELARTRGKSPPSVIDLSELRFLDLVGLRALLRAVESDVAGTARLVGATGIVRRLIELAHTLDSDGTSTARAPFPTEPTTRIGQAESAAAPVDGARNTLAAGIATANGTAP